VRTPRERESGRRVSKFQWRVYFQNIVTGDIFALEVMYSVSVAQKHCLLKATGAVR
jgi:hypothetical protein